MLFRPGTWAPDRQQAQLSLRDASADTRPLLLPPQADQPLGRTSTPEPQNCREARAMGQATSSTASRCAKVFAGGGCHRPALYLRSSKACRWLATSRKGADPHRIQSSLTQDAALLAIGFTALSALASASALLCKETRREKLDDGRVQIWPPPPQCLHLSDF